MDALELVFVKDPLDRDRQRSSLFLTWLTAGIRTAVWSGASSYLAYMGLLGFWEKAMTTLALIGNGGLPVDCILAFHWGCFAPAVAAVLCLYPTDYGFHADDAGLRVYDTGDCLLWHGQARRGGHDDDFWRERRSCG